MPLKTFEIVSYNISASRSLTLQGGQYQFYALIECRSAGADRLWIYFLTPGSPVPDNAYNPAAKWATIFLPAQLYGWYRDLLLNEKPVYAYCNKDKPEWNQISTGNEFTGETEPMPDVDAWLTAHPAIRNAIIWEAPCGTQAYPGWNAPMKAALANAFKMAWNFASVMTVDPVPNLKTLADTDTVVQILLQSDAWSMFLAYVAQSLAVEIGNRVGWSIAGYSSTGLAQLFDSRETFRWNAGQLGYEITFNHGVALPCAPNMGYSLLYSMIGGNRFSTIAGLLDWCRSNLRHFSGTWATANVYDQWQYRGFPPVLRMIQGTPTLSQPSLGVNHMTGGCWGTTGFLRALLRTVNIPVSLVTHCGHAQPNFVEDGLYLSHGDDPYNQLTTAVPPMPISEILINQAQFDVWFGAGVPNAQQCHNMGRRPDRSVADLFADVRVEGLLPGHREREDAQQRRSL